MRWFTGIVTETSPEAINAVSLTLEVPGWPGHLAGQHVFVRLTAQDGYTTQRSYSIATPPGADRLQLTVVHLDDGEVSTHLTSAVQPGDALEVGGPIGGYFVWEPFDGRPVLLVGGGSGVVPLMAMLRHHVAGAFAGPMNLVYSARTEAHILYREELSRIDQGNRSITVTLTRETSSGWLGRRGRVDAELLSLVGWDPSRSPNFFVCGPASFVDAIADQLLALGHRTPDVRTERFG